MDNCKEVFALLSQYLDRELPADLCDQMETHIAGCDPCVEFVESLKRTVELCRGAEFAERPAPLSAGIKDELAAAYRKMMTAT